MDIIETTYSHVLNTVLNLANPIKRKIIKTECEVHKHINLKALKVLHNDKFMEEFYFFSSYLPDVNRGSVWADQDFKSSNHFYGPHGNKKDSLYGRKNAMELGIEYYFQARSLWKTGNFNNSLFYLGAALHIVQDMTVPQHANIRLLNNHREYETFVKRTYQHIDEFEVRKGAYLLNSISSYIKFNARTAIKIYKRYKVISDDETRYYHVTKCALPLAIRTTAGAMVMFYKDVLPQTIPDKTL